MFFGFYVDNVHYMVEKDEESAALKDLADFLNDCWYQINYEFDCEHLPEFYQYCGENIYKFY